MMKTRAIVFKVSVANTIPEPIFIFRDEEIAREHLKELYSVYSRRGYSVQWTKQNNLMVTHLTTMDEILYSVVNVNSTI